MLEWNPLNMQDSGLKTAVTDSCVLMKKQGSQSKVIQLTEEGMKAISDNQLKQEADMDRVMSSLEEIKSAKIEEDCSVQSRVNRFSSLLASLKKLTQESEVIKLIRKQGGESTNDGFDTGKSDKVEATEADNKASIESQFKVLTRLSCFVLVYPEITPTPETLVKWVLQEFAPQLVWDKKVTKVLEKQENSKSVQVVTNEFPPNTSIIELEEKLYVILNKLTGLNRFMSYQSKV